MAEDNVDPQMLEQLMGGAGGAPAPGAAPDMPPADMPPMPPGGPGEMPPMPPGGPGEGPAPEDPSALIDMLSGGPGAPSPEDPAEGEPLPDAPAEGGEGGGEQVPLDQSEWEEATIVEGLGTPDEHEDPFWTYGSWGIELDTDQKYEAYAIADGTPAMMEGGFESFEAAAEYINDQITSKTVKEGAPAGGEGPAEATEPIPADVPEASIPDHPPGEGEEGSDKEDKDKGDKDKEDKDKEDEEGEDKESGPAKKSAAQPSMREMMGMKWASRTSGANGFARVPSTMGNIAKSQNRTTILGGIRVRVGYDKDMVDMYEPRKGKVHGDQGGSRRIDPSIRSLMKPASRPGNARTGAKCVDCAYGSPAQGRGSAYSSSGAPSIEGPYREGEGAVPGNAQSALGTPSIATFQEEASAPSGSPRTGIKPVGSMY